jgi:D-beta-D-heptose 7-phosphate kinase/D-beta-D-heptose 1-phosphate adenosyltransferase
VRIETARAREILQRSSACRVLVLGDLMLDRYVWGRTERISPEAPVPVVQVERQSTMLGGAGNVVRNLVSLGAQVDVVATVGDDAPARELHRLLDHWKINPEGLVIDPSRQTTEKTRVIASGQQVVRYDLESEDAIAPESVEKLLAAVRARVPDADGVIIEDYGKGMLLPELVTQTMDICARAGVRVFVDPKQKPWDVYRGAELVKPNLREAQEHLQIRIRSDEDLERVGRELVAYTGAQVVAVTRSGEGMSLFPADGETLHFPTLAREVADQAGAGDTAIATLTLARLAGADWGEAALLANEAGGFVVGIPGTATLTPEDLLRQLEAHS